MGQGTQTTLERIHTRSGPKVEKMADPYAQRKEAQDVRRQERRAERRHRADERREAAAWDVYGEDDA